MNDTPVAPNPALGGCALARNTGLRPVIVVHQAQVALDGGGAQAQVQVVDPPQPVDDFGVDLRDAVARTRDEINSMIKSAADVVARHRTFLLQNEFNAPVQRFEAGLDTQRTTSQAELDRLNGVSDMLSAQNPAGDAELTAIARTQVEAMMALATLSSAVSDAVDTIADDAQTLRNQTEDQITVERDLATKALLAAQALIGNCLRWGYDGADKLDAELKSASAAATSASTVMGWVKAVPLFEDLEFRAQELIDDNKGNYDSKLATLTQLIDSVEESVAKHDRLIKALGSSLSDAHLEQTRGKIAAAKAMGSNGRNEGALDVAIAVAQEAKAMIDAIDTDKSGGSALTKAAEKAFSDSEKMINNHAKIRPVDAAKTKKALAGARAAIEGLAPQDAKDSAERFAATILTTDNPGDWKTYQGRAQLQLLWAEDIRTRCEALDVKIARLNAAFGGVKYSGSLIDQVEALRKLGTMEATEATYPDADGMIIAIETTLMSYFKSFDTSVEPGERAAARDLLVGDQMAAMQAAKDLEEAQAAFELKHEQMIGLADSFGQEPKVSAFLSTPLGQSKLDAFNEMLASAKKMAETKDFQNAMALLDRAMANLKMIVKEANNETFDQLKQIDGIWKTGVRGFRAGTKSLKDKMAAACSDIADAAEKKERLKQVAEVGTAIDTLEAFFAPEAFTDLAKAFSEVTDPQERKRLREKVLSRIRLYRDRIKSDPVMRTLVGNPFKVTGIASSLVAQIQKIELETLRTL